MTLVHKTTGGVLFKIFKTTQFPFNLKQIIGKYFFSVPITLVFSKDIITISGIYMFRINYNNYLTFCHFLAEIYNKFGPIYMEL